MTQNENNTIAKDCRIAVRLRTTFVSEFAPSLRLLECLLEGARLSASKIVSVPFGMREASFFPLLDADVTFSSKRMRLEIVDACSVLPLGVCIFPFCPVPCINDDFPAIVKQCSDEVGKFFVAQTFLVQRFVSFLLDFYFTTAQCYLRQISVAGSLHRTVRIVGETGAGKSFFVAALAASSTLRRFFACASVDFCTDNAASVAHRLSALCCDNPSSAALISVENLPLRLSDAHEWTFEARQEVQIFAMMRAFAEKRPVIFVEMATCDEDLNLDRSKVSFEFGGTSITSFRIDWSSSNQAAELWRLYGPSWAASIPKIGRLTAGFFPCDVAAAVWQLEALSAAENNLLLDSGAVERLLAEVSPARLFHAPFRLRVSSPFCVESILQLLPSLRPLYALILAFSQSEASFNVKGALDFESLNSKNNLPVYDETTKSTIESGIPRGAILAGPSGSGKSLFVASALCEVSRHWGVATFFVDAASLRSKFVGDSEKNVRRVFASARAHVHAIVVLDNFECIAGARHGFDSRLLNVLLSELDATPSQCVFVLGVTRDAAILDEAVRRAGRLSALTTLNAAVSAAQRKFFFSPAFGALKADSHSFDVNSKKEQETNFGGKSARLPCFDRDELQLLIERTEGFSVARLFGVVHRAALLALRRSQMTATHVAFADLLASI